MLYGGAPESWCKEHGVDVATLPAIVRDFHVEQHEIRLVDLQLNQQLVEDLQCCGTRFGSEVSRLNGGSASTTNDLLQYVLNTSEERRVIDAIQKKLTLHGIEVGAFEHDGLFVMAPFSGSEVFEIAQSASDGYPLTIKAAVVERAGDQLGS